VERWTDRLGPCAPGELRVGIFWQGSPAYPGDRFRSAPLEAFRPLAAVPGVKLISFQKGHGVEQIAPLAGRVPVLDFGDELDRDSGPFQDTAALTTINAPAPSGRSTSCWARRSSRKSRIARALYEWRLLAESSPILTRSVSEGGARRRAGSGIAPQGTCGIRR
jgi:hypothetical protein